MTDLNQTVTPFVVSGAKPVRKPRKDKGVKRTAKTPKAKKPSHSGVMTYIYYERYRKNGGNCGDDLAVALTAATTFIDRGKSGKANRVRLDMKKLIAVAKEYGVDVRSYDKLNSGMVRMDVGNKLRAMPSCKIGGKRIVNPDAE